MAKSTLDIHVKEVNNQTQGKGANAKTRVKMGPASGARAGNPTKSGGINRATKGR